jgi:hypothetical protein
MFAMVAARKSDRLLQFHFEPYLADVYATLFFLEVAILKQLDGRVVTAVFGPTEREFIDQSGRMCFVSG